MAKPVVTNYAARWGRAPASASMRRAATGILNVLRITGLEENWMLLTGRRMEVQGDIERSWNQLSVPALRRALIFLGEWTVVRAAFGSVWDTELDADQIRERLPIPDVIDVRQGALRARLYGQLPKLPLAPWVLSAAGERGLKRARTSARARLYKRKKRQRAGKRR